MKKLFAAFLILSLGCGTVMAQSGLISAKKIYTKKTEISEYVGKGVVPEQNGKVVFTRAINAEGKSKADIYNAVASFATLRFEPNSSRGDWREPDFFCNIEYAKVTEADKAAGKIAAQGAEEMVFSNKALSKDYTHIYYRLSANIVDGAVNLVMDNIAYVYVGSAATERIPAEDWITDKEALNKKGNLRRINGKFRVKTVDLFNEIVDEITACIKK